MSKKFIGFGLVGLIGLMGVAFFIFKTLDTSKYETNTTNGKVLYTINCAACHGDKGHGDGVLSKTLITLPSNIYKEISNPFSLYIELSDSVLNGVGDEGEIAAMPKYKGVLTEKEVYNILAYIKDVNK